jgi:carbamoyl-phosphate synthase large subunit
MTSIEDAAPWHAIGAAGICGVVPGPRFAGEEFPCFLRDWVKRHGTDVVIPSVDSATVALAVLRPEMERLGVTAVVSDELSCRSMHDKQAARETLLEHRIPIPDGDLWPKLAKPRFGSSSRGHVVFRDAEELAFWAARHCRGDYLVQPFLEGTEYSVDCFVSAQGKPVGAVARVREVVSGGEVMVTRTDRDSQVLDLAWRILNIPGWRGPINIQIMRTAAGVFALEVNPRFSSGATCAIEAGLDCPRWLLWERLGRRVPEGPVPWRSGLCMTRARKDYFVWLS